MEEKEKYYTPALEEFYIGFEYQEIKEDDNVFEKQTCSRPYLPIICLNYVHILHKLRVKYLDKESIDSLIHESYGITTVDFEEDNVYEFTYNKAGMVYIGMYTYSDKMISFYEESPYYCIFRGTIKNKSELNKLMEQLNIL